MSTIRKFAGQTIIYGFSTIVARLINFVLTPVFVKKFPASVYGILSNLYAWSAVLSAILAFGMETTFFRYLQKNNTSKAQVYNNTFIVILVLVLLFISGTSLFARDIAGWILKGENVDDTVQYVWYFVFTLSLDALAIIPFAKVRAEGRALRYGLIKLANIIIFVSLTLLCIVYIPYAIKQGLPGAEWAENGYRQGWLGYIFIAQLIASSVTLLLLLPELLSIRFQFNRKLAMDMFLYSFPILVANISFIINENLDKIFLEKLLPAEVGKTELGIYAACVKMGIFLNIAINAFRLGAEPFFFSQAKKPNSGQTYALIMDYLIILMAIATIGIVANIEILKYFISGGTSEQQQLYWSGLHIAPILLMAYIFLGVYMNLSIWYKLSDQTRFGLYISGTGAIITIVLNIIFIPLYSYTASAWITLITYFVMMSMSYILGQKYYAIPYHISKNILYILLAGILSWLSFVIFKRNLIIGNIILMAFILYVYITEKERLKQFLKK